MVLRFLDTILRQFSTSRDYVYISFHIRVVSTGKSVAFIF